MKTKRIGVAAIALAAAGALVLTGCASGSPESTGAASDSAIISVNNTEPQNPLVPTNTNEVGGGKIVDSIFAGLIAYEADGTAVNDVAESIETEDSQNYTITIRDGLTFTNDEPVTAQSFVDAWNYGAALDNAQFASYFFNSIEGYSADENVEAMSGLVVVDDTTFTVKLMQPESDFPLRLGYSAYMPMPSVAYEDMEAFGEDPIGNGPYMLEGEGAWKHNEGIKLVANPDYDGPREPQNGGIDMRFYASADASYADLQGGNLDMVDEIPDSALTSFQDEFDGSVNQAAALNATLTFPQDRMPHFAGDEGKLRRAAVSMAIDREEVTDVIFSGSRIPAKDFSSPVIEGFSEDIPGSEVLEFNPEEAAALWAQADAISPWSGTLEIGYNADGPNQGWVDAVANQLKNNLGIDAVGTPYPTFAEFRDLITTNQNTIATRAGWQADYPALYNWLGPLFGTGAASNDGDYSNPAFDALLAEGLGAATPEAGIEKFQEAEAILFEDLPVIPLWNTAALGAWNSNLSNVEFGWNSVPLFHEITKSE
ncbi:peptide ABC transporter substrate-binding protein [Agromyces aerolatus]|uniref:peptide ABC transporter substrate-binding protein n=1 Tax=Agromyces sp. LY-1074 TaxID=3074080 RepID=UPI0028544879|nr:MULTISPECIES: ABC transporter substrate-binding protein [unclassified Agromyces]MDR5698899.1 ABC transporter substrate-binding protein [Agromyces sp. LY-1074]MDR5705323.1 ABC transporter substrate-binding protein [Agromyces sp. LY-1358]